MSVPVTRPPLRVFCTRHIATSEGDLIVAGTPGTVIHWDVQEGRPPQVMVRWDHYLFTDTVDEDGETANTHVGLFWPTDPELLRWHGP